MDNPWNRATRRLAVREVPIAPPIDTAALPKSGQRAVCGKPASAWARESPGRPGEARLEISDGLVATFDRPEGTLALLCNRGCQGRLERAVSGMHA